MSKEYLKLSVEDSKNNYHICDSRPIPIDPKKTGQRERIYRYMEENEGIFNARIIASKLGINEKSARKVMWTMWKSGLIERDTKGWYYHRIHKSIHGMVGGLNVHPRVQNLWVYAGGVDGVKVGGRDPDAVWDTRFCRVRLWFTSRRGQVSYHVHVPDGLCHVGLGLVEAWVDSVCVSEGLSIGWEDWRVSSLEVFVDDERVRLNGVDGITVASFGFWLIKYYRKDRSRREIKSPAGFDMSLDGMYGFLTGTVSQMADRVQIKGLREDITRLEKLVKYSIRELGEAS